LKTIKPNLKVDKQGEGGQCPAQGLCGGAGLVFIPENDDFQRQFDIIDIIFTLFLSN